MGIATGHGELGVDQDLASGPDSYAPKTRILILGGGFGGVYTARHLEKLCRCRPDVEIALVSRDNFLVMTPLLFEVCSGTLDARHCSFPIRAFLRTTRFVEATVQGIDLKRRVVLVTADGRNGELAYDHLVLALGGMTNRGMIPGSEHAFTFKTLADAFLLRNHMIDSARIQYDEEGGGCRSDSLHEFFGTITRIGFMLPASSSDIVGVSPCVRKGHSGTMERRSDASIESISWLTPPSLADRPRPGDRLCSIEERSSGYARSAGHAGRSYQRSVDEPR